MLKPTLIGSAAQAGLASAQHNTSADVGRMAKFKRVNLRNHVNRIFSSRKTFLFESFAAVVRPPALL
jgi:hypothetical protein